MYAHLVKRLQILIDDELEAALERAAEREGRSKGAVVRESLRKQLQPATPIEDDPIWRLAGAFSFDPVDPERIDDVVYATTSEERSASRAARRAGRQKG